MWRSAIDATVGVQKRCLHLCDPIAFHRLPRREEVQRRPFRGQDSLLDGPSNAVQYVIAVRLQDHLYPRRRDFRQEQPHLRLADRVQMHLRVSTSAKSPGLVDNAATTMGRTCVSPNPVLIGR